MILRHYPFVYLYVFAVTTLSLTQCMISVQSFSQSSRPTSCSSSVSGSMKPVIASCSTFSFLPNDLSTSREKSCTTMNMIWGKQESEKLVKEEEQVRTPSPAVWSFDLRRNGVMPDNSDFMEEAKVDFLDEVKASEQGQNGGLKSLFLISSVGAVTYFLSGQHDSFPMNIIFAGQNLFSDPTTTLENIVCQIETMGNLGILYFGIFYTLAEILAIPAFPLTASAGYLFGVKTGTAIVLLSASIAASASFLIGRTALRPYVEGLLEKYPKFKAMDKVIGKEGFRLILLLRLSPLFPFALSNYLYGVTSVDFISYFWGTLLGFLPGTVSGNIYPHLFKFD